MQKEKVSCSDLIEMKNNTPCEILGETLLLGSKELVFLITMFLSTSQPY